MANQATGCERGGPSLWRRGAGALRDAWLIVVYLAFVVTAACGGSSGEASAPDAPSSDGGAPDAGVPDAMPPDGNPTPDPDPEPDPGPFPRDPHSGQFEWAVFIPGIGDQVVLANGADGSIFVAGDHKAAVTFGEVRLPAPVGAAVAVLKLDARARPIWARSLGGADALDYRTGVRSASVTGDGDVVIGGVYIGAGFDAGTGPLLGAGGTEGFVARLDGSTGATQWARSFSERGDDQVTTVAADPASDALYVHGEIGGRGVNGVWQPSVAFLERYDASGQRVWSRQLAMTVAWQDQLSLDRLRGPVMIGRYHGRLDIDELHLEVEPGDEYGNLAVLGFTPDGQARFARQIFDESQGGFYPRLLAAPDGRLYVSTSTENKELVLDDEHGLKGTGYSSDPVLMRMTPEGAHEWATLIDAELDAYPTAMAADPDGAVYLLGRCNRSVMLAPVITCNSSSGNFLVSYGPSGEYRWSTYLEGSPLWAQAVAAVPGKARLLLAGEAHPTVGGVDFGGVRVQGVGLFVASVVTGPTYAEPLPPPPTVTSVVLEGVSDGEVRQGGSGVVVVTGENLEQVKSVRVGSRDLFVADGTPGALRIPYDVPHGEALGPLPLVLTHPRGQLSVTSTIRVSPIIVAPSGTDAGRGTLASPWRLCRADWQSMAQRGDTIRLLAGVHTCDRAIYLQRGVTVEGEGTARTKVGAAGGSFRSFSLWEGPHGRTRFSQLTFQGGEYGAINEFFGVVDLSLRDVDFVGLLTSGVSTVFASGRLALERVRYLDGRSSAIYAAGELQVDGRLVTVQTRGLGIKMERGRLALRDSTIESTQTAIEMGDLNDPALVPRHLLLERSKVLGLYGVSGYSADLVIVDSELIGTTEPHGGTAIDLSGGTLTATRTRIHGFFSGITPQIGPGDFSASQRTPASLGAPHFQRDDGAPQTRAVANIDLDEVDVNAVVWGVTIGYYSYASWLRMRRSTIFGGQAAVRIGGPFSSVDLGTSSTPGGNTLTSAPNGNVIFDDREQVGAPLDATGTTLNGHSYSGELRGPRDEAHLWQRAANVVRF